jgi:2-dehydropantoate 2-reductase
MTSILIVGTGALANIYASKFSNNPNCEVQFFCEWEDGVNAIQQKGITCISVDETIQTKPLPATTNPQALQPADLILVLVKSWQTRKLVEQIKDKRKPNGACLTLQNGLGNLQILYDIFGKEHVLAGTTMISAVLLEPAKVQLNFLGSMQVEQHPAAEWIIPLFQQSGFEMESNPNLDSVLWGKLLLNAIVNPLTAIIQQPNGALLETAESLDLMDAMIDEILQVIRAKQIDLPYKDAHIHVRSALKQNGKNSSSMAQDWRRNAPTEIDTITGAILDEAKKYNISMPVNQTVYQLVKAGIAAKRARE